MGLVVGATPRILVAVVAILMFGFGGWAIIRVIAPNIHPRRQLVEDFIYRHARDPGNVEIQSVQYGPRWKDGLVMSQYVLVKFREKSTTGPNISQERLLRIEEDQVVYQDASDQSLVAKSHTFDWSLISTGRLARNRRELNRVGVGW